MATKPDDPWAWFREADPAAADAVVESIVFQLCLDPSPRRDALRMWWLKNRMPATYGKSADADDHAPSARAAILAAVEDELDQAVRTDPPGSTPPGPSGPDGRSDPSDDRHSGMG